LPVTGDASRGAAHRDGDEVDSAAVAVANRREDSTV
jgi:hypothetical protein